MSARTMVRAIIPGAQPFGPGHTALQLALKQHFAGYTRYLAFGGWHLDPGEEINYIYEVSFVPSAWAKEIAIKMFEDAARAMGADACHIETHQFEACHNEALQS